MTTELEFRGKSSGAALLLIGGVIGYALLLVLYFTLHQVIYLISGTLFAAALVWIALNLVSKITLGSDTVSIEYWFRPPRVVPISTICEVSMGGVAFYGTISVSCPRYSPPILIPITSVIDLSDSIRLFKALAHRAELTPRDPGSPLLLAQYSRVVS
jgi:hypothetical protein